MRKRSLREPLSRGGVVSARRTARRCIMSCVQCTHAHTRVSALECAKDGAAKAAAPRNKHRTSLEMPERPLNV